MARKTLSKSEVEQIKSLFRSGLTQKEIGAKTGRSQSIIWYHCQGLRRKAPQNGAEITTTTEQTAPERTIVAISTVAEATWLNADQKLKLIEVLL